VRPRGWRRRAAGSLAVSASSANTSTWWTTEGSLGTICTAFTQRSSAMLVGTTTVWYGMKPSALTAIGSGSWNTASGAPIFHSPSAKVRGSGSSFGSPSGLPAAIHAAIAFFSASLIERSFDHGLAIAAPSLPCIGAANHGGIAPSSITVRIIVARRATASYESSANGPTPPVRWHSRQFAPMMREMSRA
jgi:hypothetical protein